MVNIGRLIIKRRFGGAMIGQTAVNGYCNASPELIPQFEAIDSAKLYALVSPYLPKTTCHILDIGAGTGRDAAWLAGQGHQVLAVEPAKGLRDAGMWLHHGSGVEWLDDQLPELRMVVALGRKFDRILLSAVWQHLEEEKQALALFNLAALLASEGYLIMSLRHGPGSPSRPGFETDPDNVIEAGRTYGLDLVFRCSAPSIQEKNLRAGVS